MKYSIPPGVFDILPSHTKEPWKNSTLWAYVESIVRQTAKEYGYLEIRTPLFERTELFQRSVGGSSDIVSKEMYTFEDRGGRSLSLRPEGTAAAMRAFIENQLHQIAPIQKLFYIAPMFRYERSQAGRYRQHHQFGIEAIGNGSAMQDAEIIDLIMTVYKRLGLQKLTLFINSLGDAQTRERFKAALIQYLQPHLSSLSSESQARFQTNPLRILDSKDPRDREIVASAPSILDFLSAEESIHFEEVKHSLDILNISYQVNPLLVRGLDYYNRTVFEVVAGELGAQNSIGGGGRYDGMLKTLGGPDLPSIGCGTGLERILQTMINQKVTLPPAEAPMIYFIPLGEKAKSLCFELLHDIRQQGVPAQMELSGKKIGKAMQFADQLGSQYVAVIGDEEIKNLAVQLKEMETGEMTTVSLEELSVLLQLECSVKNFTNHYNKMAKLIQPTDQIAKFLEKFTSLNEKGHLPSSILKKIKNSLDQT
jgi:histidyl-tRNA synthetase